MISPYLLFKHVYHKILRTQNVSKVDLIKTTKSHSDLETYYENRWEKLKPSQKKAFHLACYHWAKRKAYEQADKGVEPCPAMEYDEFVNEYSMVEVWEAVNGFMIKAAREKLIDGEY
jgi:hypothetical protein